MRYPYHGTTTDQNGAVIQSCTVTVYLAGTTTLATVYAASTGAAATGSVITSNSTTGAFVFWVDTGDYGSSQLFKIILSKTNFTSVTYDNLVIYPHLALVGVGTVVWNPASLNDAAGETSASITVTGATLGTDFVLVSAPYDLEDCTITGYVQAANTVEIRIQNESAGTKNFASGTWRVAVFRA